MSKYIPADKLTAEIHRWSDGKLTLSHFTEIKEIIESIQQEQPEVDLEKEMDKFYGMYRNKTGKTYAIEDGEPCFDWKEDESSEHEMRIARHFYELGLNARKEDEK